MTDTTNYNQQVQAYNAALTKILMKKLNEAGVQTKKGDSYYCQMTLKGAPRSETVRIAPQPSGYSTVKGVKVTVDGTWSGVRSVTYKCKSVEGVPQTVKKVVARLEVLKQQRIYDAALEVEREKAAQAATVLQEKVQEELKKYGLEAEVDATFAGRIRGISFSYENAEKLLALLKG